MIVPENGEGQQWIDFINQLEPKNKWFDEFLTKEPLEFNQIKDLPNSTFVKTCFLHVARRPDLLGTFLHAEILNHLEVGSYVPEDKFTFTKSNFMVPIKKDSVYNRLRRMYETEITWERARIKRIQSLLSKT